MIIKYPCGCEYRFSGFISEDGKQVLPDYIDDDGNDYELCTDHYNGAVEKW